MNQMLDARKPETGKRRIERGIYDFLEGKHRPCCGPGCLHRSKGTLP